MSAETTCPGCGEIRDPFRRCPFCGDPPGAAGDELTKLQRAIADLNTKDLGLIAERKRLSLKLQAAIHQRDVLAVAQAERDRKGTPKQRGKQGGDQKEQTPGRTASALPPVRSAPSAAPAPPGTPPRQRITPGPDAPRKPEASPREVQNVLLTLGSLLIAITAVVFALIALSNVSSGVRLTVLAGVTIALLATPWMLVRRQLSATAESLATVGLALLPVDGYLLLNMGVFARWSLSDRAAAGIIFAGTAIVAFLYHQRTALTTARFVTVLAAQPVLALLTVDHIRGPAGWALVLTGIAALDAAMAWAIERNLPETPEPVVKVSRRRWRPSLPGDSMHWLRELTWILHGLAIGAAGVYSLAALLTARSLEASSRAAFTLLLAAVVGLVGALMLRKRPLGELAAGALTLAIIGSAARVAVVALPDRAIPVIAFTVTLTGIGVQLLPRSSRRGPQVASAIALAVVGVLVIGSAVRAAVAPVLAALPVWRAELADYAAGVTQRAANPGPQLVLTIALLTVAAALALPPLFRREAAVAGATLTALAAPASLSLSWTATLWVLALSAIALLAIGMGGGASSPATERFTIAATTGHAAQAHLIGTVLTGVAAIGVGLARSWATAGVLTAFTVAGAGLGLLQRRIPSSAPTRILRDTAAGAAAFAFPGAVGAGTMTLLPQLPMALVLAATFLAASAMLTVAAIWLVAQRHMGWPLTVGAGLGTLVSTGAAFGAEASQALEAGVGALLLAAAILLALAPSVNANRRADRWLDGADVAAAAVTVAATAALARTIALFAPGHWLFLTALAILVIAVGVRALAEDWQRGPAVGAGIAGAALTMVAGYPALAAGIEMIAAPGELWAADISRTIAAPAFGWQAPAALGVLALAAATALPRPRSYDAAAIAVVLATVGTPAALGWPWWSSIALGLAIALSYAVAAVMAFDPRAGYARLAVAIAAALHALSVSLVRPWTTAAALGVVALISVVVVILAIFMTRLSTHDTAEPPPHLEVLGGAGVLGGLLAGPAAVTAFAAGEQQPMDFVLSTTLIAAAMGLGMLTLGRRWLAPYLGWGTVGVAAGGTLIAILALISGRSTGIYAAAAVLMAVLAELVRASMRGGLGGTTASRTTVTGSGGAVRDQRRWPSHPGSMAAAASVVPGIIALASLLPPLREALITPYANMQAVWQGPPAAPAGSGAGAAVLTAAVLTLAATLAAIGFGGGSTRAVSVIVPGLSLTMLIAPVSLALAWPATILAGLLVFTVCMLSVALTVPPHHDEATSGIRASRIIILFIGLAAGGAGLAGSLTTPALTIFTFGGAVGVGLTAALGGQTQRARILGWLGGAIAAQLFVLSVSLHVGAAPQWSAFAVLAVGTALIFSASLLPRFTRPEALPEASAVEWAGYIAGVIAVTLAFQSLVHVAALLVGWGAVLGVAATRIGRPPMHRRVLFWAAGGSEIVAWWLIMRSADVALPEAYTVPFALLALVVGLFELKQRPTLGSWAAYGPALIAGFGPTIVVVLATQADPIREIGLLLASIAVLVFGSRRQQQAPVAIGAVATTITALHALTLVGTTWLAVGIGGVVLIILGASSESRRRAAERYTAMR